MNRIESHVWMLQSGAFYIFFCSFPLRKTKKNTSALWKGESLLVFSAIHLKSYMMIINFFEYNSTAWKKLREKTTSASWNFVQCATLETRWRIELGCAAPERRATRSGMDSLERLMSAAKPLPAALTAGSSLPRRALVHASLATAAAVGRRGRHLTGTFCLTGDTMEGIIQCLVFLKAFSVSRHIKALIMMSQRFSLQAMIHNLDVLDFVINQSACFASFDRFLSFIAFCSWRVMNLAQSRFEGGTISHHLCVHYS